MLPSHLEGKFATYELSAKDELYTDPHGEKYIYTYICLLRVLSTFKREICIHLFKHEYNIYQRKCLYTRINIKIINMSKSVITYQFFILVLLLFYFPQIVMA